MRRAAGLVLVFLALPLPFVALQASESPLSVSSTEALPASEKPIGSDLYKAHCALCHGGRGQGVPPMFPGLNSKSVEVYAAMMQNYRAGNGHKVMVDMAKSLTEAQIQELLAHIATFPPKQP